MVENLYFLPKVNTERFIPFCKFYIIDIERQQCCGHFVVANNVRRWYEVHLSPSNSHIVLRPDVRYHYQAFINYEVQVKVRRFMNNAIFFKSDRKR